MPWPFLFLFGTKVVGHAAATKAAVTASAKGAASAAKGTVGKSSSGLHLPPGTKTVAKEVLKRLGRGNDDEDVDDDSKSR